MKPILCMPLIQNKVKNLNVYVLLLASNYYIVSQGRSISVETAVQSAQIGLLASSVINPLPAWKFLFFPGLGLVGLFGNLSPFTGTYSLIS